MPDTMPARTWSPDSWRACPIRQVPSYPDPEKLASMEARIGRYPPLVSTRMSDKPTGGMNDTEPRVAANEGKPSRSGRVASLNVTCS